MYYHIKFGSSASKVVRISIRELSKLGSVGASTLAMGAWFNL